MEAGTSKDNISDACNDGAGSQTTVEIKIKTLDSQVYTCQVEQDTPVPVLKEKIASLTGVPAESQRLICRGKVLKDEHLLSAYSVEDGHTLHLVTRHVPQPNTLTAAGVSRNEGIGEDEGRMTSDAGSHTRSGQVSHSVVLGTFNIPDHGDVGMTEVGRILGSVLNTMGLSNLIPVNAGANNGGPVTATLFPGPIRQQLATEDIVRVAAGSGRSQTEVDSLRPSPSLEQGISTEMELQFNTVHGLRAASGFAGAIPATVPSQIRLIQQAMVVPDALTTLSQYLNRMEEVFVANGQQPFVTAPNSTTESLSLDVSMHRDQRQGARGYTIPTTLGTIIRRTKELLSNQATPELLRLASQLENDSSSHDAAVRGEVQSAALRGGTMMQHLGALLLELGRAALTLQMGHSPAEGAVNAGPAVFISALGPNPLMVQPLPFQPGAGLGAFTPQPAVAAMVPSMGSGEVPQNFNIHIHAGDMGLPSALSAIPQTPFTAFQLPQIGAVTSDPSLGSGFPPTSRGQNAAASNSNNIPLTQVSASSSLQGGPVGFGEHGAVRILPMRTLVAAVPAALHNRPPAEATGTTVGVFYPLLARFQQLNPAQLSQQTAFINGGPMDHPVPPGTASPAQQQLPASIPTMQPQVQLQAWAPSNDLVGDGQRILRPANFEGTFMLPFISSASEISSFVSQHQQSQSAGIDLIGDGQILLSQESPVQSISHVETAGAGVNNRLQTTGLVENGGQSIPGMLHGSDVADLVRPILQQYVEAYEQAGAIQTNQMELEVSVATEPATQVDRVDAVREDGDNEQSKHKSTRCRGVFDNEGFPVPPSTDLINLLSSRELSSEDNLKLQENGNTNDPVGLGLGELQSLSSRTQKRPYKQIHQQCPMEEGKLEQGLVGHTSLSMNGGIEQIIPTGGQAVLCNLSSSLASPLEDTHALDTTGQISEGLAQLLDVVGSSRQALGGHNCNVGEVISQLMATQSQGSLSQPARGMLQQVVPIVSHSFLRGSGGVSECTVSPAVETESRSLDDTGATHDISLMTGSEGQKEALNQDEFTQWNEKVSTDTEQHQSIQIHRPASEVYSGSAPVAKRRKT